MQISEQWVREWIDPKCNTRELAEQLTMAGLEVDSVEAVCPQFLGVVVAQVDSAEPHPQASLTVCQVSDGKQSYQVVCGAPNVAAKQKVALAKVGAFLPSIHQPNETLEIAQLKGVASHGMLVSLQELGLAEKSEEILVLHPNAPLGDSLWDYLHLNDTLLELDLTPNRGDCLSIQGVARELHALTRATLDPIRIDSIQPAHDDVLKVTLDASKACPRYSGRIIKQVDCRTQTPDWMVEKLRRSGIRAINPIVDIMNYVMIELGQPMHAFDLQKVQQEIIVRPSKDKESLVLLDGQAIELLAGTTVIADAKGPLAMAGIMGGQDSGVTASTTDVFLESAYFDPIQIAGKARRHGLHTDSSHRFERGVDYDLQVKAIERATQWILDICGGKPGPVIDVKSDAWQPFEAIRFSPERAKELLGFDLDPESMRQHFERLGCVVNGQGSAWEVQPPSYRFDLKIQEDLVEELARLVGYHNIVATMPKATMRPQEHADYPVLRFKQILVDLGYQEAISYSFVDPKFQGLLHPNREAIALTNPIASDLAQMRLSLWTGLLKALQYNAHRQQEHVCLFETGLVFLPTHEGLKQVPKIGGVAWGALESPHWSQKQKPLDFFDVKGHVETLWRISGKSLDELEWESVESDSLHPGQSAALKYQGEVIGLVGMLHPSVQAKLDIKGSVFVFELQLAALTNKRSIEFKKPSTFPAVRRDLSLVVEQEITCSAMTQWLKKKAGNNLTDLNVFDLYQGSNIEAGKKSIALGLVWQDCYRTLKDTEIEEKMQGIIQGLQDTFGATLRD